MKVRTIDGGCCQLRMAIALTILSAATAHAQNAFESLSIRPEAVTSGLRLGANTGIIWSDNIGRLANNPDQGTVGQVGLQLGYHERTRRLAADVDVNAAYQHYFDNTFDNDVVGGMDGSATVQIVPERFQWLFQETFGQINSDPFSASTPDNRENINYFTTGPDFMMNLGGATSLRLSGRFSDTSYEVTPIDSRSYGGGLTLLRELSGVSSLSLNATSESVKFTAPLQGADYDRHQAFLRYQISGARTTLGIDGGYTQVDGEAKTNGGLLARLTLSRKVSASSSISFNAGTQFSDSGDMFRQGQRQFGVGSDGQSVIGAADSFKSRFVSAGWTFSRNRTSLGLMARYQNDAYQNATGFDHKATTVTANAQRQLGPLAQLNVFASFQREDFGNRGFTDDEYQAGLSFERKLSRLFGVSVQYNYYDRSSSNGGSNYKENRVGLFLTYTPFGHQ